jgi:hypothetical protein
LYFSGETSPRSLCSVGFLVRYGIGVSLPHPNVTAKYSKKVDALVG